MKILFITAPLSKEGISTSSVLLAEPLCFEYLAAAVQEFHDVKFFDLKEETGPQFKEIMESFQPDIIGCTACTTEVNPTKEIFAEAKKISPGILTVVGGHHATVMPQDFFDENVDLIVMGEGVGPFRKICQCYEKKKSFEDIENIYFRNNGKMVLTRKEPFPPLNTLPFPNREITSHLRNKYRAFLLDEPMVFAAVMGSYGCIYHCNFCAISDVTNHKVYKRDIHNIIEEIAALEEPFVAWMDDEFFLDPQRAILMAKEIEKAGIKKSYSFMTRADTLIKNPKCLEEWAKISEKGIVVGIGLESFKDQDLKQMKKGTTVVKNDEAIHICHQNNAVVRGSFIVQQYYEKADFRNFLDYVRKLDVDAPTFTICTPLPGTKLYEEVKDQLISNNYNLFDMTHTVLPTKLPLKQFYKEYSRLIKKSFPITKRIKKFRKMDPKLRVRVLKASAKMFNHIKNAHRDYDKSLW